MDIQVFQEEMGSRDAGCHVVAEERNGIVEGLHQVDIAVVDAGGNLLYSSGNPYHYTYSRSCIKPIQALPILYLGAAESFQFTDGEIAIICGSHSGQPEHLDTVRSVMKKAGLEESMLKCGGHLPFHKETANAMSGRFKPLHDNCSGKHAGVLSLCKHMGWDIDTYTDPSHEAQNEIVYAIADIGSLDQGDIGIGMDGCSIPNFAFPIYNMALMFARMGDPTGCPYEEHLHRIKRSILRNPHMIAGTGRFDEVLMRDYPGRVISKAGAMGLQTIAAEIDGRWIGISAKIKDGKYDAVKPLIYHIIDELGMDGGEGIGGRFRDMEVKTRTGDRIGSYRVLGRLMKPENG